MEIASLDAQAMDSCRKRLDALSKPLGSLGLLEEYAVRLAGMRGRVGGTLEKRKVLTFAADNGIYAQDITPVPQEVTVQQSNLIAQGRAGVNVLARQAHASVQIYNVGVKGECGIGVLDRRVIAGTADMSEGPAMRLEDAQQAFDAGREAVCENRDMDLIGIGEMGICNTSAAAAVGAVLLGLPSEALVGPGAGIDEERLCRKKAKIQRAIEVNIPDPVRPLEVVAKVGSLDMAAMAGAFAQCAQLRIPAVIDGCISACAALVAVRMEPGVGHYLFGSHRSTEPIFSHVMEALGLHAPLDLGMRLGEGSGTPIMFQILADSLAIVNEMATLDEAQIDSEGFVDLRKR